MSTSETTTPAPTAKCLKAQAYVADLRTALAAAAAGNRVDDLAQRVQDLAAQEAILGLEDLVCRMMVVHDLTEEQARIRAGKRVASDLLTVGADDTWSGRGNDLARVVFDAKRKWAAKAIEAELDV